MEATQGKAKCDQQSLVKPEHKHDAVEQPLQTERASDANVRKDLLEEPKDKTNNVDKPTEKVQDIPALKDGTGETGVAEESLVKEGIQKRRGKTTKGEIELPATQEKQERSPPPKDVVPPHQAVKSMQMQATEKKSECDKAISQLLTQPASQKPSSQKRSSLQDPLQRQAEALQQKPPQEKMTQQPFQPPQKQQQQLQQLQQQQQQQQQQQRQQQQQQQKQQQQLQQLQQQEQQQQRRRQQQLHQQQLQQQQQQLQLRQQQKLKLQQSITPEQQKLAQAKQRQQLQQVQQMRLQKLSVSNPVVQKPERQSTQRLSRPPPAAAQSTAVQTAKPAILTKAAVASVKHVMTAAKPATVAAKPAASSGKLPTQIPPAPPPLPPNVQQPSRALQIAGLIMNFLGPNHPPPQNPQLPTLNALRTRLTTTPSYFDTHPDHLAWQVREAIRTEFFKVLYPSPPPNSLLTLVTATESIIAPFPPRPFFFPGARVAVPTEAGSRRAATSLQLRFKQVSGTTVAEALLHLDGPNGGGFQWVQAPALTPLSMYAPHTSRGVQKKPKKQRAPKPAKPRKKKEKPLPPPPPVPTKPAPKPHPPPTRPTPAPAPAPKPTQAPAPSHPPPPVPTPAPRMAGVVARLARQEASGVHVPDALRGTSPPPRGRIIGEGRFLSHVSGAMRSAALDIDKLLGIERLVARRETGEVEYFVKWSGVPMKQGSWESREALLKDVPALVRDFDVRHPEWNRDRTGRVKEKQGQRKKEEKKEEDRKEAEKGKDETTHSSDKMQGQEPTRNVILSGENVSSVFEGKKDGDKKEVPIVKQYTDDVTGLPIPSWLDTPIVELNIGGMVLQIRRPNEAILHNDATSAVRDAKKRQTRFKQENMLLGERLFPLTKPEAKSVIDAAAKDHRLHNRVPILFPRGIGRVSPTDHGYPFSRDDALKAPACWEGYFLHLGMVPTEYTRCLPPHMPTLDDGAQSRLLRARDDLAYATACEHRERARLLLRESFRHTGAPPPEHIFRDGVRAPPGEHSPLRKKRALVGKNNDVSSRGLLRARESAVDMAIRRAKRFKGTNGAWFDEIWGCWRPDSS